MDCTTATDALRNFIDSFTWAALHTVVTVTATGQTRNLRSQILGDLLRMTQLAAGGAASGPGLGLQRPGASCLWIGGGVRRTRSFRCNEQDPRTEGPGRREGLQLSLFLKTLLGYVLASDGARAEHGPHIQPGSVPSTWFLAVGANSPEKSLRGRSDGGFRGHCRKSQRERARLDFPGALRMRLIQWRTKD